MDLQALGFTQEELQDRVVNTICDRLMIGGSADDEGNWYARDSAFRQKLDEQVRQGIADQIVALAEKHVLPNVAAYIDSITLTETNKWGEKIGQSRTFTEYLVHCAEKYMTEEVDHDGKGTGQSTSYGNRRVTTRVAFMIDKHLHYNIETAMKQAMAAANSSIVKGLEAAVRLKLEELSKAFVVAVKQP